MSPQGPPTAAWAGRVQGGRFGREYLCGGCFALQIDPGHQYYPQLISNTLPDATAAPQRDIVVSPVGPHDPPGRVLRQIRYLVGNFAVVSVFRWKSICITKLCLN